MVPATKAEKPQRIVEILRHELAHGGAAIVFCAMKKMTESFNEAGADNVLLVVLTNENGLGPAEEEVYRKVVDNVRADTANVK